MNPLVRNILIAGTALVLVSLIGGFTLWVMPVEAQIAQLAQQLETAKTDRTRAEVALKSLEASTSVIREQMDQLALFNLRDEQDADNVLQTRSTSQLIQVTRILEDASISIGELNPTTAEIQPITAATGSNVIASVQKQHFKLSATGIYRDVLTAFERLKKLPPTVAVNNFQVRFVEKVGSEARVGVEMDLSFNFLMKAQAGQAGAGAKGPGSSAFEQMMRQLGSKGGFLLERMLEYASDWLGGPAYAATGRAVVTRAGVQVVADGPVRFRTFTLSDGRLVVDMPGLEVPRKQVLLIGRSGVRSARLGQLSQRPLIGRLVLDTHRRDLIPGRTPSGVVVPFDVRKIAPVAGKPGVRVAVRAAAAQARASLVSAAAPSGTPRIAATPLPPGEETGIGAPAPAPEPEPLLRRIAVRPRTSEPLWRVAVRTASERTREGVLRRIDVRPFETEPVVRPVLAFQLAAPPQGSVDFDDLLPPKASVPAPPAVPAPGGATNAAEGTGSVTAGRTSGTIPEVPIGRAEPFWPLVSPEEIEAYLKPTPAPTPLATSSATSSTAVLPPTGSVAPAPVPLASPATPPPPPPRLRVTLRGVLMSGDRATGLFEVEGAFMRAAAGMSLGMGHVVRAVGRDFALVTTPYGTERKDLARTWIPVVNAPAQPAAAAGAQAPAGVAAGAAMPLPAPPPSAR